MSQRLEDVIHKSLSEKESINALVEYRKTTEGIILTLLKKNNLYLDRETIMLGKVMEDNDCINSLLIDTNMKANINYIRLYGNRSAHFQEYDITKNEIAFVKSRLIEIIYFYYKSIDSDIPNYLNKYVNKEIIDRKATSKIYNVDINLYLKTLLSIENSELDYPKKGMVLLANICSKIIIDLEGAVPTKLFNDYNKLNIDEAIKYLKKNKSIDDEIIAELDLIYVFLKSSSQVRFKNRKVPEVPIEIKKKIIQITDWFFKIVPEERLNKEIKIVPFVVDLFMVGILMIAIIIGIFYTPSIYFLNRFNVQLIVSFGLLFFLLAYLYSIFYSIIPSIRNRKLFNIAHFIGSFSGLIGVLVIVYLTIHILTDGKPDMPYRYLFIAMGLWAISLQISIYIKSDSDTKYEKALRGFSLFFLISTVVIIIIFGYYFYLD